MDAMGFDIDWLCSTGCSKLFPVKEIVGEIGIFNLFLFVPLFECECAERAAAAVATAYIPCTPCAF